MTLTPTRAAASTVSAALLALLAGWYAAGSQTSAMGGTPQAPTTPADFRREPGLDRSGNDLRREVLAPEAGIEACEQLCRTTAGCAAYTFVKRSTTVPRPICWIKDTVPHGYESDCCISGVRLR